MRCSNCNFCFQTLKNNIVSRPVKSVQFFEGVRSSGRFKYPKPELAPRFFVRARLYQRLVLCGSTLDFGTQYLQTGAPEAASDLGGIVAARLTQKQTLAS